MNRYDRKKIAVTEKAGEFLAIVSGVFLCISTIFMFANMLTRTFANFNLRFVYELCGLCAAGVASFAIPYASLRSAHSTMDIITSHLSRRTEAAFAAVSGVITVAVMTFTVCILTSYAYQRTLVLEATTTSKLPTYIFRWVYALGMLLTIVAAAVEMVDMFRNAAGKTVVRSREELDAPALSEAGGAPEAEEADAAGGDAL